MPAKQRALNVKQLRFCELVAAGESSTDAYLQAGYSGNRGAARANAARLIAKDSVAAKIASLRKPQTRKVLMSRDRKRELLAAIAEDPGAAKGSIIRAIEVDAKLAGHFEPDRTEIEVGPKTLLSIKERAAQVASGLVRGGGE